MNFISIYFIVFLILCLCGYILCPPKFKYIFLLLCNILYLVSYSTDIAHIMYLLFVIVCTYIGAVLVEKNQRFKKLLCIVVVTLVVGGLFLFKYIGFIFDNYNAILDIFNISRDKLFVNVIAPLGISFYSFQSIGYLIDVYRSKIKAEKNFFMYATFVSFFPTILSGPIERASNLLEQIKQTTTEEYKFDKIKNGIILVLWGAFTKLVIADRLSVLVDTVFSNHHIYGGFILLFGAIAYTLQIYCDFYAYSIQAIGIGRILGFDIQSNFDTPYFAVSIKDFWRRWHISLSSWFRDYVYIPLGGNRCSKIRKNINLVLTFLLSGLWHGANWTFVIWGAIHAVYQIIGELTHKFRKKWNEIFDVNENCASYKLGKMFVTFMLVSLAWIFFRAENIDVALDYIKNIIFNFQPWDIFNMSIYDLGLDTLQMNILAISLLIFVLVDALKYITKYDIDSLVLKQNSTFVFIVCTVLFFATFIFGMYGPAFNSKEFIYFNF